MQDDLIGFVLGALDSAEHEEIRRKVEQDAGLRQQVLQIERSLEPLRWAKAEVAPPVGLAERTCSLIATLTGDTDGEWETTGGTAPVIERRLTGSAVTDAEESEFAAEPVRPARHAEWVAGGREAAVRERQWTVADFVVAAGVCLAASCLFFPALINSRYHWQLAGCQNNMRQVGQGLIEFSGGHGGYFPAATSSGPFAAAGIYGPQLIQSKLVPDGRVFRCPAKGSTVVIRVPDLSEILAAKGFQLDRLHREMGGDYAYHLGYLVNGRLYGVRNLGRTHGAILADAPLENLRNVSIGTHGKGQNVLFEDGHVCFLATRQRPGSSDDDIFFNNLGLQRAGMNADDVVLGASHVAPLPVDEVSATSAAGEAVAPASQN